MSEDTERRLDLLRKFVEFDRFCKTIEFEDYDPFEEVKNPLDALDRKGESDLVYLVEHGLIADGCYEITGGYNIHPRNPIVPTVAGIDLVSDDGGLTTYQKRLTLDIEVEKFRDMLLEVVKHLHDDEPKKKSLTGKIKTATSAGLKSIAGAVLKQAVEGSTKAIPWTDILGPLL